ncbi:TIGR03085 family metal-binding protein [Mycolicibacterium sp. 120270]|uniref:TIGR03085 family metal-binding protein n=1 Tax=Mycolicibacterium sp. 120270 TaxID=3090600 RepID=UPI00299DEE24|nr:TIGR03085 family metal-binding protein [Mycolicibacterium sp. 120270]MDX1885718.1 TIGR03085 family metal-binding protein [Mycolicibacterium sp. 120270]
MTAAARERAELVNTMRAVGPEAPTLCGDWTTRDLAAHLILRERRPDAAAGILVPKLAGYTARKQKELAERTDWPELLELVASGPPLYSPLRLLDPLVNTTEMFIHHEDVRRAGPEWQPRRLDDALTSALRRQVRFVARMSMRRAPAAVTLREPDGTTLASLGRGPSCTITGEPPELLLFVSGRDAALIEFEGDADTIAAVRAARRGL